MIDTSIQGNGGRRRSYRRGSTGQLRGQLQLNTCGMIAMARNMPITPEAEPFPQLRPPRQERRGTLSNTSVNVNMNDSPVHHPKQPQQQQQQQEPQHHQPHTRRTSRRNSLGYSSTSNSNSNSNSRPKVDSSESSTRPSHSSRRGSKATRRASASHGPRDTSKEPRAVHNKSINISSSVNHVESVRPRPSSGRQLRRASVGHAPMPTSPTTTTSSSGVVRASTMRERRRTTGSTKMHHEHHHHHQQQQQQQSLVVPKNKHHKKRVSRDSFGEDIFALHPNSVTTTTTTSAMGLDDDDESNPFGYYACDIDTSGDMDHHPSPVADEDSQESTKPVFQPKPTSSSRRRGSMRGASEAVPRRLVGTKQESLRHHRDGVHLPFSPWF